VDYACGTGPSTRSMYDGIIGFAPNNAAWVFSNTNSIIAALFTTYSAATLPHVFAIDICQNAGQLTIGAPFSDYGVGSYVASYQVSGTPYPYMLQTAGVSMGDIVLTNRAYFLAVDSGTTQLLLPNDIYRAMATILNSYSVWTNTFGFQFFSATQCLIASRTTNLGSIVDELPAITIRFPGFGLDLSRLTSYVYTVVNNGVSFFCPAVASISGNIIVGGVPLFESTVIVFNFDEQQIGFSHASAFTCPSSSNIYTANFTAGVSKTIEINHAPFFVMISFLIYCCY